LSHLTRKVRDDKYDLNQFIYGFQTKNVMVDGIKCSRKVKKTETR